MASLVFYSLVFVAVGSFFLFIHLMMGKLLRPINPEADKLTIYECGEPTIGSAWIQFDLRYYVVALLFVIFDVEVAFFFPWAVVFGKANELARTDITEARRSELTSQLTALDAKGNPRLPLVGDAVAPRAIEPAAAHQFAWLAMIDMAIFFGLLLVGFAYLWKRGDIDWVRSTTAERLADAQMPQPPTPASQTAEMIAARR